MARENAGDLIHTICSGDGRAPEGVAAKQTLVSLGARAVGAIHQALRESPTACPERLVPLLGEIGSDAAISALVALLADPDPAFFQNAARILVSLDDTAVARMRALLPGAPPEARRRGAEVFGRINSAASRDALAALLDDPDPLTRARAALQLGERGDRRATARLGGLLARETRPAVRRHFVAALGKIDDPLATRLLAARLGDDDPGVRAEALRAISALLSRRPLSAQSRESLAQLVGRIPTTEAAVVRHALRLETPLPAPVPARPLAPPLRVPAPTPAPVYDLVEAGRATTEEESRATRARILRAALGVLVAVVLFFAVGPRVYQPESPLPFGPSPLPAEPLYRPNAAADGRMRLKLQQVAEQRGAIPHLALTPTQAYRLSCPRYLQDRLLDKKECDLLLFAAESQPNPLAPGALELQFLVLRDRGRIRLTAIEVASPQVASPTGVFVQLRENDQGSYSEVGHELRAQVAGLVDRAGPAEWRRLAPGQIQVFAPFAFDTRSIERVEALEASNVVIRHLLTVVPEVNPDASLGAPVFLVREPGAEGSDTRALYSSDYKVLLRPLFTEDTNPVETLAHELTHAYLDGLGAEQDARLAQLLPSMEAAHPRMMTEILPRLYCPNQEDQACRLAHAEEALAWSTGALAAQQTRVSFASAMPPGSGEELAAVASWLEPLASADAELLATIGLIPTWMSPTSLEYHEPLIRREYYQLVNQTARQVASVGPQ